MKAILHHNHIHNNTVNAQHRNFSLAVLWHKLLAFSEKQQPNRILWIAIGIFGHGTLFTPIAMGLVFYTSHVFGLLITVCFSMILVMVVTLAALPTKYVIPVFLLSLAIDIGAVISALIIWMA